ncbi:hypothetical protein HY989_01325 [Candidatus Micrarchaeota archaeon]|nr:hypothetical protein [Candidatus Micrarchaeota archaeon]
MNILIIAISKSGAITELSQSVLEGCKQAGQTAKVMAIKEQSGIKGYFGLHEKKSSEIENFSSFDLVFLGFEIHSFSKNQELLKIIRSNNFQGSKIALFGSFSSSKAYLEKIEKTLKEKGAAVLGTIGLKRHGALAIIGKGAHGETDFARVEAFTERTINNFLGRHITKDSEKSQIKNYLK